MNSLTKQLPPGFDLATINRRLPPVINILLILLLSAALAHLTWMLIPQQEQGTAIPIMQKRTSPGQNLALSAGHAQQITRANLFGVYTASPVVSQRAAPAETRLNLVLRGVLAATPMSHATAIISVGKSGDEEGYGIGDQVSSAKVKEIHEDYVILERNGSLETLRMPTEFSNDLFETGHDEPESMQAKTPGAMLGDIRNQIMKNPTAFGEYAIPIPYNENGKLRGYRLSPQKNRALFDSLGLSERDVITEINGISLNNPANGIAALRKLQRAKTVSVKILRNGAEIPMTFQIP